MKRVAIVGGTFSVNGRFTGKNASGQRFYVGATLLAQLGITVDTPIDEINFPFFILCESETHTDANNEEFDRWDAKSAFSTMDAMLEASIADDKMDILAKAKLAELAKSAGLSATVVQSRVAQSV